MFFSEMFCIFYFSVDVNSCFLKFFRDTVYADKNVPYSSVNRTFCAAYIMFCSLFVFLLCCFAADWRAAEDTVYADKNVPYSSVDRTFCAAYIMFCSLFVFLLCCFAGT